MLDVSGTLFREFYQAAFEPTIPSSNRSSRHWRSLSAELPSFKPLILVG